ncbi:unnamed protein product, partial [marine sediment metagenome]
QLIEILCCGADFGGAVGQTHSAVSCLLLSRDQAAEALFALRLGWEIYDHATTTSIQDNNKEEEDNTDNKEEVDDTNNKEGDNDIQISIGKFTAQGCQQRAAALSARLSLGSLAQSPLGEMYVSAEFYERYISLQRSSIPKRIRAKIYAGLLGLQQAKSLFSPHDNVEALMYATSDDSSTIAPNTSTPIESGTVAGRQRRLQERALKRIENKNKDEKKEEATVEEIDDVEKELWSSLIDVTSNGKSDSTS